MLPVCCLLLCFFVALSLADDPKSATCIEEFGVAYIMGDMAGGRQTENTEECCALCRSTQGCRSWSRSRKTKNCNLKYALRPNPVPAGDWEDPDETGGYYGELQPGTCPQEPDGIYCGSSDNADATLVLNAAAGTLSFQATLKIFNHDIDCPSVAYVWNKDTVPRSLSFPNIGDQNDCLGQALANSPIPIDGRTAEVEFIPWKNTLKISAEISLFFGKDRKTLVEVECCERDRKDCPTGLPEPPPAGTSFTNPPLPATPVPPTPQPTPVPPTPVPPPDYTPTPTVSPSISTSAPTRRTSSPTASTAGPTGSPSAAPKYCAMVNSVNYLGEDMGDGIPSEGPQNCCDMCGVTEGCKSWTFDHRVQRCFLKDKFRPSPVFDPNDTSGYMSTGPSSDSETCHQPKQCLDPESFVSHWCVNSVTGRPPEFKAPANGQNNFCDSCMAGHGGLSCEMCKDSRGCESGEACSHRVEPRGMKPKSLQCELVMPTIRKPLAGSRSGVRAITSSTFTPPSGGWGSGGRDGQMDFSLWRAQPPVDSPAYLDRFFKCKGTGCKLIIKRKSRDKNSKIYQNTLEPCTSTFPDSRCVPLPDILGGDGRTTHARQAHVLSGDVQSADEKGPDGISPGSTVAAVVLALEALAFVLAGYTRTLKEKRLLIKVLCTLVFTTLVLFIGLVTYDIHKAASRAAELHRSGYEDHIANGTDANSYVEIHYQCRHSSCECAADPPPWVVQCNDHPCTDEPFCSTSMVGRLLGGLNGTANLYCDNSSSVGGGFLCSFSHDQILGGEPLPLTCLSSGCEEEGASSASVRPSGESDGPEPYAWSLIAVGALAFFALLGHYGASKRRTSQRMAAWARDAGTRPGVNLDLRGTDLGYTVNGRKVLANVCINQTPGRSLAIMGPSGAGKTTLLDILAARDKSGKPEGQLAVGGSLVQGEHMREVYRDLVGYVSQDDCLLPQLTAYEAVLYSARLRLPLGMWNEDKQRIAREVLTQLRLSGVEDTQIGSSGLNGVRGLSGGERRRVSIACELVASPAVLILDEPTSGLDSYSAKVVMETIVGLGKGGGELWHTTPSGVLSQPPVVIFSIHQPSTEVFSLFDDLLLLSEGGVLYYGPARGAVPHFISQGVEIGGTQNPGDFILAVAQTVQPAQREGLKQAAIDARKRDSRLALTALDHSGGTGMDDVELASRPGSFVRRESNLSVLTSGPQQQNRENGAPSDAGSAHSLLAQSPGRARAGSIVSIGEVDVAGRCPLESRSRQRRWHRGDFYHELGIVLSRAFRCLSASYQLVLFHAVGTVVVAGVLCLFYHSEPLNLPGTLNKAGAITFALLLLGLSALSALELFYTERDVFVRERSNGYYGSLSYFLSKLAFDIVPLRAVPALYIGALTYVQMGFRTDSTSHFGWFLYILAMFNVGTAGIAVVCAALAPSFGAGALLAALVNLMWLMFTPIIVQGNSIPPLLRWMRFGSPYFLAFESLLVNELGGQQCQFAPTDAFGKESAQAIDIPCNQYLFNLALDPTRFQTDVWLLSAAAVFYLALGWVCIHVLLREKR
eukprot:Hpha_TRINITY_DN1946_c0_g1::TRINITY_DN1946_c0_g1_i1::g.30976::m.30976